MDDPEVRYTRTPEGVHIAYQVIGDGPFDILWPGSTYNNVEYQWQIPSVARFLRRLGSFARVLQFDPRGTGLSDRVSEQQLPPLETRMADGLAVLDAEGCSRALLLGHDSTGPLAILFAATYPDRTSGVLLYSTFAAGRRRPDYPWAWGEEEWEPFLEEVEGRWGDQGYLEEYMRWMAPSIDRPDEIRSWASYLRLAASPGAAVAMQQMERDTDVRDVLPSVHVPALVLHRRDVTVYSLDEARYLADRIAGAQLLELDGNDHLPWYGETEPILRAIETFHRTIEHEEAGLERVLGTVLFTDIVGSTEKATELGDRSWHELVERHHAVVRAMIARYRGTEIDTAGDGFFARFDGPARAVRCAAAVVEAVRPLGLEIRAGVHTGEIELEGEDLRGIAVHIGARIAGLAGSSEVLASSTVKDLVAGSGLEFEDAGEHELKGVPDRWRLYRVAT